MQNTATAEKPITAVKAIPEGFHTITPSIICKDAAQAIEFYKKAVGATEVMKMCCEQSGKVMHAELKVGDSIFFVSDEMPAMNCMSTPAHFWLYVNDCDASFKRAIDSGATVRMPLMDAFWGDRMGQVTDPYGHSWTFATHKQDLTPEQIKAGQKAFMENVKAQAAGACTSGKTCSNG